MNLLSVVELVTTVVTLFLMASGIPSCLNMYRTRNTRNVPFIFFLVSVLNSAFALGYGLLVNSSTLIFINVVGVILWSLYVLVFIGVSKSKSWPLTQLLMLVLIMISHGVYLRLVTPHPPALTNTLGLYLLVWSTVTLLTPILDIIEIVQQGSSAGSDIYLLIGGTSCCLSWSCYGYLLHDFFVYGPNVLGLAVNCVKMATISAYRGSAVKTKTQ